MGNRDTADGASPPHPAIERGRESAELAPYAARAAQSLGRRHSEPPPRYRSEFQRDRDRIIHANAFRRLVYKTQVFVNHQGDLYRTRLTHSLEVAQIGRSVARAMRLNEDLTEAICLAHDLGHTPFGHAGQDALNACMQGLGGFEHNLQSLRLVDTLEEKYADFQGLNLCFETREGILKHCSKRNAEQLGEIGTRFLQRTQPGLEAQLANIADEIAYNNHDVDDGLRAGLLVEQQLCEVTLFGSCHRRVLARYPGLSGRRRIHETVRRMIGELVNDLVGTSIDRILAAAPGTIAQVRERPEPLIGFSDAMLQRHLELKQFLREFLYKHERVNAMTEQARKVVTELFEAYRAEPQRLPEPYRHEAAKFADDPMASARVIADYVAGMTDRYALSEHKRLCE